MGTALARRPRSQLVKLANRALNALPLAGEVRLFARDFLGANLLAMDGGGILRQMTGANAQLPTNYVEGCFLTWRANTTLNVGGGYVRSSDDTFDILIDPVIVNFATVGVINGLDAGAMAANTWYAIYVVGDSSQVNPQGAMASASFAAPTLPAGYDKYRRVGAIRSGSGTTIVRFFQRPGVANSGSRVRRYWSDAAFGTLITGLTATVFTDLDLSGQLPPSSKSGVLEVRFANGTAGALADNFEWRPKGANSADGPTAWRRANGLTGNLPIAQIEAIVDGNQFGQYKVTQGGASQNTAQVRCLAYDDEI